MGNIKEELIGKKFQAEGKIFTVYAAVANGVFAHEGDVMETNEKGEVINPRYFDYDQVESNLITAGRPSIGITKKVSLTLPEEVWGVVEKRKEDEGLSQSQTLRTMIENSSGLPTDKADSQEKERRFAEFKDFVFNTDVSRLKFHIYQHGLLIVSPVEKVEPYYDDEGVKVNFKGGNFYIWSTNLISKCIRPGNLMIECETCYNLYNEYEEHIGYLYTEMSIIGS